MKRTQWTIRSVPGVLAALVGTTGCYTGLDSVDLQQETLDPSGSTPNDDDDGDPDGDDTPPQASLCEGGPSLGPSLTWRLTAQQYDNTVRDLLGIEEASGDTLAGSDGRIGVFSNNTDAVVGLTTVEQYGLLARELAQSATTDLSGLVPCDPAQGEASCAEDFIADFGARALRRPLSPEAQQAYQELFEVGQEESFETGVRMVIEAMLQSPRFLYRVEGGTPMPEAPGVLVLDDYELASRLSYFLLDSMPDAALMEAAAAGELSTREGLRAQAERLLAKPEAVDALARFHFQWLGIEEVEDKPKSPRIWDENLAHDAVEELRRFVAATIIEGDGSLQTLLTGRMSHASPELAKFVYGQAEPIAQEGEAFELPEHHGGILLRSGFLAAHSHDERQSPVLSGYVLRNRLLCQSFQPPAEVDTTPPEPDPTTSTREQYTEMLADPYCMSCHNLINPLGFSMLNYDSIGRFQTTEPGGHEVDASGDLVGTDVDGYFEDAVELIDQLAQSEDVADCVAAQWFDFAVGHPPHEADECGLSQAREVFRESGYDLRALILSIIETDTFRYRMAGEE